MYLAAWIVLYFIGFYAQSLILSHRIMMGLLIYLLDASFVVLLIRWRNTEEPNEIRSNESTPPLSHAPKIRSLGWGLLGCALISIVISLALIVSGTDPKAIQSQDSIHSQEYEYALLGWIGFLGFIFLAAFLSSWKEIRDYPKRALLPLGILLLLSLFMGMFRLTSVPFTVHGDEGMVGLYARQVLNQEIPTFFSTSWYSIPQFFFFLPACGLYIFGDNLWGLRMSTTILGTLSLIPFYFLARYWWGTWAAFLAGLLLVTNHWFIHLMHCGVNYVQVSFFTIALLALWAYTLHRRSLEWLVASGGVMGVALFSYQANHLLPILWIFSQVGMWIFRKISFRWLLASITIPLITAGFVISPLIVHDEILTGRTGIFQSRSSEVIIFTPKNQNHLNGTYRAQGDPSLIYREQIKRSLLSTVLYIDTSIQYGGRKPFLDRFAAVLFMIGVMVAAFRFFEPRWSIPVLWMLGILLTGGAMTVDAPFFPRLAGISALLFLPIAGVVSQILPVDARTKRIVYVIPCFILIVFAATTNLHHYFQVFPQEINIQNIHYPQTQMAYCIQQRDPQEMNYVFDGPHFSFHSGTVLFLTGSRRGEDIQDISSIHDSRPCAIFVDKSQSNLLPALKERFSDYTMINYTTPEGLQIFTSLTRD